MWKQLLLMPLLALSLALAGCAGTQQQNQQTADQVFGNAKLAATGTTLAVTTFTAGCAILMKDKPFCAPAVIEFLTAGTASLNSAVLDAEAQYAKTNTSDQAGRMAIAQSLMAAVRRLGADLAKYDGSGALQAEVFIPADLLRAFPAPLPRVQ